MPAARLVAAATALSSSFASTLPIDRESPRRVQATDASTQALRTLYERLNGVGWTVKDHWMEPYNPCGKEGSDGHDDWYGITCQGDTGIEFRGVKELVLPENNLNGVLPSEIGVLSNMVFKLDLAGNSLRHSLPSEVGMLSRLTRQLELQHNAFTGSIPTEIGMLMALTFGLFLQSNTFTQDIPTELGKLTRLGNYLDLRSNALCGSLPTELNKLKPRVIKLGENDGIGQPCDGDIGWPTKAPIAAPTGKPDELVSSYPSSSPTSFPTTREHDGGGGGNALPTTEPTAVPSIIEGSRAPTPGGESLPTNHPTAVPSSGNEIFTKGSRAPTSGESLISCNPGFSYDHNHTTGTRCVPCAPNTYSERGSGCDTCPRGTSTQGATACTSAVDCISKPGWYRTIAQKNELDSEAAHGSSVSDVDAHRCPVGEECIGADQCLEGSTGDACLRCEAGFGKMLTGVCAECPDRQLSMATGIVAMVCLLAGRRKTFTNWWRRTSLSTYLHRGGKRLLVRGKIFVNVVQAQALGRAAYLSQSNPTKYMSDNIGQSVLASFDLIARLDCLDPRVTFYERYTVGVFAPIVYGTCLYFIFSTVLRLPPNSSADSADRRSYMISNLLLSVWFYFYFGASSLAMQYFACTEVESKQYLRADARVKCTDPDYSHFSAVAYLVLTLVPFGGPLIVTWLLSGDELRARARGDVWRPPIRQSITLAEARGHMLQPEDEEFEEVEDADMERIIHVPALGFHLYNSPVTTGANRDGQQTRGSLSSVTSSSSRRREGVRSEQSSSYSDAYSGVANPLVDAAAAEEGNHGSTTGGADGGGGGGGGGEGRGAGGLGTDHDHEAHIGTVNPIMDAAAAEESGGGHDRRNGGAATQPLGQWPLSGVTNPLVNAAAAEERDEQQYGTPLKGSSEYPKVNSASNEFHRSRSPPDMPNRFQDIPIDSNDEGQLKPRREVSWEDFSAEIDASSRERRQEKWMEKSFAFLVGDYRPSWYLFEPLDCCRKLALCYVFIITPWDARLKLASAVFVSSCSLVVLGMSQPYLHLRDNFLACSGQLSIMCFFAALLAVDSSADRGLGDTFVILPLLIFLLAFVVLECTEHRKERGAAAYHRGNTVDDDDDDDDDEIMDLNIDDGIDAEGGAGHFEMSNQRSISWQELQKDPGVLTDMSEGVWGGDV